MNTHFTISQFKRNLKTSHCINDWLHSLTEAGTHLYLKIAKLGV